MMNGWILVTESVKAFTEQRERCCQFLSAKSLVVALPHKPEAALLLLQKFDHVRLAGRERDGADQSREIKLCYWPVSCYVTPVATETS